VYGWTDTGQSLYKKSEQAMILLLVEQYSSIRNNKIVSVPRDLSSSAFQFRKERVRQSHIYLDKTYTGRGIINLLRARPFSGHPGCVFGDNGAIYEINIAMEKRR